MGFEIGKGGAHFFKHLAIGGAELGLDRFDGGGGVSLSLINQHFFQNSIGGEAGAWGSEVAEEAPATPGSFDEQDLLVVMVAGNVSEFELRSDAIRAAVANGEVAFAIEEFDPDIAALDPLSVLLKVTEEVLVLRQFDLVFEQLELGFAFHVGLAGEDEDGHGFRGAGGAGGKRAQKKRSDEADDETSGGASWVMRKRARKIAGWLRHWRNANWCGGVSQYW